MTINPLSNAHYPDSCPPKVSVKTIKVYQPSSFRLFSLKNKTVYSGHTNSNCTGSNSTGGPGDNTPSIDPTFKGGLLRLPQKGKKGVDKKHGSYERYLAKKVHNISLTCA